MFKVKLEWLLTKLKDSIKFLRKEMQSSETSKIGYLRQRPRADRSKVNMEELELD